MRINTETITQIQTMLQADPALLAQLQAQTELAGVAAMIAKAASDQGLDVSESDVMSHLETEQSKANAVAMSDSELEQVAGGSIAGTIGASIMTLGVGCGVISIVAASKKQNCGKSLAEGCLIYV